MTIESSAAGGESLSDRKKNLLLESAQYRADIIAYKNSVKTSLEAESVSHMLMHHIGQALGGGLESVLLPAARNWQKFIPLAVGGISFLSKKGWGRYLIRGALLVGGTFAVLKTRRASRISNQ